MNHPHQPAQRPSLLLLPFAPLRLGVISFLLFLALSAGSCLPRFVKLNDPISAEEHLKQGRSYEQAGDWSAARKEYDRAVRQDPKNARAWMGLGNTERALRRTKPAWKSFGKARELAPGDAEMLNDLAKAFLDLGRLQDAASAADQAVALGGPRLPYSLDTRGLVKLRQGELKGAIQDLHAAWLQAPADAEELRLQIKSHLKEVGEAP
jgi:tetratricopeptide (TPR) repeat protein